MTLKPLIAATLLATAGFALPPLVVAYQAKDDTVHGGMDGARDEDGYARPGAEMKRQPVHGIGGYRPTHPMYHDWPNTEPTGTTDQHLAEATLRERDVVGTFPRRLSHPSASLDYAHVTERELLRLDDATPFGSSETVRPDTKSARSSTSGTFARYAEDVASTKTTEAGLDSLPLGGGATFRF